MDAVCGGCVGDSSFAGAFSAGQSAVFFQESGHFLPGPGQLLPVIFRRHIQNVAGNPAVGLKHGSQNKDAAAFRIQTLKHDIGTGELQLLFQKVMIQFRGKGGYFLFLSAVNIRSIIFEA